MNTITPKNRPILGTDDSIEDDSIDIQEKVNFKSFLTYVDTNELDRLQKLVATLPQEHLQEFLRTATYAKYHPDKPKPVIACLLRADGAKMTKYLVGLGAELTAPDIDNAPLLSDSFNTQAFDKLQYLLEAGVSTHIDEAEFFENILYTSVYRYKYSGTRPNSWQKPDMQALAQLWENEAQKLSPETIQKNSKWGVLISGAELINIPNAQIAFETQSLIRVMKILLDKGMNINAELESHDEDTGEIKILTPMIEAIRQDNNEMFNFLTTYNYTADQMNKFLEQIKDTAMVIKNEYYKESLETQKEKLVLAERFIMPESVSPNKLAKINKI